MSELADSASGKRPNDDRSASQWRPLIFAVLLLALVLRLLAAVVVERHVNNAGRRFFVEGDANGYWELAHDIVAGRDYSIYDPPRRVLRVPGFPLLLSGVIWIFGDNVFAARCVLAVVGTACCWITWLLGKHLVMRRVGFWAALMMAIHPWQIGISVLVLSETWFSLWMLLSLLALAKLFDTPAGPAEAKIQLTPRLLFHSLVCGALIGFSVLIRPGFLPWLAIAFAAVIVLLRTGFSKRAIAAGTLVAGCFLVMLPWGIRNQMVTGHFVLTSLWSGPSLYDGMNPDADGSSNMTFFDQDTVMHRMTEYEMNAYYRDLALEFAAENPATVARLAVRKLFRFLEVIPNTVLSNRGIWAMCIVVTGLICAMIFSGLRGRALDSPGLLVVIGPFLLFALVHMVFVGSLRYRLPTEYPLSILAAAGLRQWLDFRSREGSVLDPRA